MKCSLFLQVSFQEVFQLKFLATLNTSQTFTENKQQSKCKQTAVKKVSKQTAELSLQPIAKNKQTAEICKQTAVKK